MDEAVIAESSSESIKIKRMITRVQGYCTERYQTLLQ